MLLKRLLAGALALALCAAAPALADQSSLFAPTSGTLPGLTMVNDYNSALNALASCNSGASAPSNAISGSPVAGQCWLDTTTSTDTKLKIYDGSAWIVEADFDATTHIWKPGLGGGAATLASATTTDIGSVPDSLVNISGVTTITGLGSSAGVGETKLLVFAGALTLTYNATSLILPTAANITTAAGDMAIATQISAGNWRLIYFRASGQQAAPLTTISDCGQPLNLGIAASVGSNALTVNLVGSNGAAPSAANPVTVCFRSTTLATGTPVSVSITSALSVVAPSGASLGMTNATAARIWIFLAYNSGTPELVLAKCGNNTTVYPCKSWQSAFKTTTTIGAGSTSDGVPYATTGVSGDTLRIIGYLEATEATAGTWATAPSQIQVAAYGVAEPGDVIQTVYNQSGTLGSTANTYTPSATSPAPAGALSIVAQAITPTSAINHLRISGVAQLSSSTTPNMTAFIYDTTNSATKAVSGQPCLIASNICAIPVSFEGVALSSSAITYTLYGTGNSGTTYVNGTGATQFFGTISNSFLRIEEIMGRLEPANDNGAPLRMAG